MLRHTGRSDLWRTHPRPNHCGARLATVEALLASCPALRKRSQRLRIQRSLAPCPSAGSSSWQCERAPGYINDGVCECVRACACMHRLMSYCVPRSSSCTQANAKEHLIEALLAQIIQVEAASLRLAIVDDSQARPDEGEGTCTRQREHGSHQ